MAISKLILNGEVQMDVTSDTVEANKLLEGETATKNDGTKVTGTFVAPDLVISSLSVTPTESAQTFNDASISGYKPVTVGAIASDYIGSAIPMRSDVNLTGLETYSGYKVQAQQGYYSQTASYNISAASINISGPYFTYSLGYFSGAVNIITSGYAKQSSYSFSQQLSTLSSQTITPGSESQYIPANRWLTGSQTIAAISSTYIGSAIPLKSSADLTTNGSTVFVSSGYYSSDARTNVAAVTSLPSVSFSFTVDPGEEYATYTMSYSFTTSGFVSTGTHSEITGSWPYYKARTITPNPDHGYVVIGNAVSIAVFEEGAGGITVNAIPSSYIIPSGTYSVTENGTYDIGSYASVDVSVSGGGDTAIEDAMIGGIPAAVSIYSNDRILSIRYATCQYINASVFNVPNVSYIGPYAFSGNSYVNTVLTSKLLNIGSYAFNNCKNLENIDLSPVLSISAYTFVSAKLSSSLTLSYLASMNDNAFENCDSLPSVALPYYNRPISYSAFYHCSVLSGFYAPFATAIRSSAFNQCSRLTKCNIITAWTISSNAFVGCVNLSSIAFCATKGPVTINQYAFSGCQKLHDVYICNRLSGSGTIQSYAFFGCASLSNLYILSPSYVSLTGITAFRNTPISYSAEGYGSIYVPAALYDSYISGANWSYFSDRFVSLTSSEVDAIFDSLSEVNLWAFTDQDPGRSRSTPLQLTSGIYKSLNQLIGKQAEYRLLLNANPGEATITYLYSMAIISQISLQSYTTFTVVRPSLSLNFSLYVDLENNTVSHDFNSGKIYGYSFYLRCL